jgi:uridylate kinase
MFSEVTYYQMISQNLAVMDSTAISLCRENNLPIIVFNMNVAGNIARVVRGEKIGSLVSGD